MDPARSGQQEWRRILRTALNTLRDSIDVFYESEMKTLGYPAWTTRDAYIHDRLTGVRRLDAGPKDLSHALAKAARKMPTAWKPFLKFSAIVS